MGNLILMAEVEACHELLEIVTRLVLLEWSRICYKVKEFAAERELHYNIGDLDLLATSFPVNINAYFFLFDDVSVLQAFHCLDLSNDQLLGLSVQFGTHDLHCDLFTRVHVLTELDLTAATATERT